MFEGLKRFVRRVENRIEKALEAPPDSVDNPRPQRVDPDPPKNDWFARTQKRSLAVKNEAAALDKLDEITPRLSKESAQKVDDLLAKATASAARR
jgi:hypothetical protein